MDSLPDMLENRIILRMVFLHSNTKTQEQTEGYTENNSNRQINIITGRRGDRHIYRMTHRERNVMIHRWIYGQEVLGRTNRVLSFDTTRTA
jgi:hypothetical protein